LQSEEWITPKHVADFHELVDTLALDPMTVPGRDWPV
jgi:hypothetical protein